MILDFLLFPIFILSILSLGAAFDRILCKLICYRGRLSEDISIQGMFGLFFLGVMGLIANFIIPLSSPVFLFSIIVIIIFGAVTFVQQRHLISKHELQYLFISSLLLVPLLANMNPGYDGGLYHLPHQLWLREERIVFGLANFHGRFGFSSILEYINAPLWINNHFKLLSYIIGAFYTFFTLFLVSKSFSSKGPLLTLILAIVLNMAIYSGYLNWSYTFSDIPAGLLFVVVFIYGFSMLYSNEIVTRRGWSIFSTLALFTVLIKPSTGILVIWVLFVVFSLLNAKISNRRELIMGSYVTFVVASIWILRSFIVSGCIVYPEVSTCIDVSWAAKTNAQSDSNWVTAWARHPGSGLYSLKDSSWIWNWWIPYYRDFFINIFKAGLVVIFFYIGLSVITKFRNVKLIDIRHLFSVLFLVITIAFWFRLAPSPRFGIGLFILIFPIVFIFILGKPDNQEYVKTQRIVVLLLSIIVLLRISEPWRAISTMELAHFNGLSVPTPAVKKDLAFGVRPINGNQCWVSPECSPYDRTTIMNIYSYKAFLPNY